ncbi:MAG: trypsin-like peptidase domain-containing protein, partial [Candidatus Solibacter sp.]|nr:trypsin-like peptidase domain-containing protein [Candidatus Solibacter sp.]
MLLRIAMLTILPLYAQAPAPKPPAQIYAEVRESVVLIKGAQKAGSGVIVSLDGLVVTNYHVVAGEKEIWIKLASGLQLATDEVVAADPGSDLAVLKLNGKGFKPAPLGDSDMIAPGDSIVVISNPLGLEASVTNGLISGIRGEGAHRLFQISAPISPGSSGGPVFNQQGSVIGVATATIQGAQNLNLAVPSSAIRSLLNNPKQAKLADLVPANDDSRRSESVSPILQRVGTYLAKDMIEEAETQLRGGIQQYEFEPLLRLELAKLLIRTGRPQEAVQQLRITNKLTPDAWLPMALIAHLYMKRWLGDGDLSDRRTAYQTYASLLSNRELPSIKHQLIAGMLERMRSPEGTWTTNDRQRSYSVTAKQSGGFLMGFPTEDF